MRLLLAFCLSVSISVAQILNGGGGVGGGGGVSNAVTVSTNCSTAANCFNVFADAQTAMTAAYTGLQNTGGTTATALTTNDNDAGGEWLQTSGIGSKNGQMTLNGAFPSLAFSAGFKTTGTVPAPTCWGTNENASTVSTVSVAVTPTGGSGHILVAMARSSQPAAGLLAGSFSDGSNAWSNLFGLSVGESPSIVSLQIAGGYALNIAGGSYTLTFTFGGASVSNTSIYACEFSNITTSSALDGVGIPFTQGSTSTTVASGGFFATTANDLIVVMGTSSTAPTWSAGPVGFTSTVTTQASDPPFTSKDVGKKFLGTTSCNSTNGYVNCGQSFMPGQIASVTSAHVVQVNGLPVATNSVTSSNFTGWFIWGHDDGVQLKAAWNASLTLVGSTLVLPCGAMMVGQPPFLSTSTGSVYNPNIRGCVGTTIVPTMDYDFSQASGGIFFSYPNTNNTGMGAGFQNPFIWSYIRDLTVWGGGIDGAQNTTALPIFNLSLVSLTNVSVIGWMWNATVAANALPAFKGTSIFMQNCSNWGSGTGGVFITGDQSPTNVVNSLIDSFFGVQGGGGTNRGDGLILQGGYLTSRNTQFNPADSSQHGHGATVSGGWWTSLGDQIGILNVTGAAHIFLKGSATSLLNGTGITNAGGFISAQDTQVDTLNQTSGTFIDEGGNYNCSTQPIVPCGGTINTGIGTRTLSGGTFLQSYTNSNCSSSAAPAVCGNAAAGSVVVAAAATTVQVNTTAVTANSQILVTYDSSLGAKLGVTCNTTEPALYGVTARSAGVSFTITSSAPTTNPACFSFILHN